MEEFDDYFNNVTKNTSLINDMQSSEVNINVNEKLQMQRILAQRALERADAKKNTGGLPSHLLKPTSLRIIESNVTENPSVTATSSSSTLKNTQLSKLTDTSKTITRASRVDIPSKENTKFTSKSPQIKMSTESVLKDTTNMLEQQAFEQENVPNDKNVTSDGVWTDAKPNVVYSPEHNRTLSSITESPSYSCSELEFSDDDNPHSADNTLHKHTEKWLEIEQEIQPRKIYTNIPQKTTITVISRTSHSLLVKLHVKDINNLAHIARIELFNEEGLLKSQAKEQLEFKITSFITGTIELVFRIQMTDMATKARKQIDHRLVFESEELQIQLSHNKLDYGLNCEACVKKMNVTIGNNGGADLPLTFVISQLHERIYVFTTEIDRDNSDDKDSEVIRMKSSVIAAGGSLTLFIDMRCPHLAELNCSTNQIELQGLLHVYTTEPFKLLKGIELVGRVGFTKIQFKHSSLPVVLLSGQTKGIPVRNSGTVTMELATQIVDSTNSPTNTLFTIDESSMVLKPDQIANVNVTFNCRDKVVGSIKRILKLEYHRGPYFAFEIEGITEGITRNSQTGRSSTNSSDSDTLSYLQSGKLPIESTRTELIWGCVKPGKTTAQEFILRNRCSQRVRLQAQINGTGFKFIKDQTESVTTLSLMLHSLESRKITVNFSPNSKGAAAAKLMFLPIENDVIQSNRQMVTNKKQMISLYAYGGYCNVDIQKVAKDTSGKMWLSFGRLNYRGNVQRSLILRNSGSLAAFACLIVGCKVLYPFMDSSVKITPTEVVILPNKEVEVCVSFTPRQEHFKYIQTSQGIEVSEIATINVLSGPEPTRGRIRRLFNKMSHQGVLQEMSNEFLIAKLSATFVQEHMPLDLLNCKESPGAMEDLLQDLTTREISLTIEHDRRNVDWRPC